MNKYERDSQLLFVSSEANFENNGIGNQNHFKVNLADSPLRNNDSSLIKLSVKELQLRKSWYNINKTNNKVRFSLKNFTTGTEADVVVVPDIDTMINIPVGDYVTHESLVDAFGNAIITKLVELTASLTRPLLASEFSVTSKTSVYRNIAKVFSSAGSADGQEYPQIQTSRNDYRLSVEITCSITGWAWGNLPIFQFLNIALANTYNFNITNGTALSADERLNDSYILLGGPRIEKFQGTISEPIYDLATTAYDTSLSVKIKNGVTTTIVIASWFPMSEVLHTLDNVYVMSRQSRSQASSSLESITNEHAHNFIASSLLAKASRDVQTSINDIGVYFKITQPSYFFSILSQPFINEIEFELRDHRGRELPYNDTSTLPLNVASTDIATYTGPSQVKNGNSVVSLVVLAEKFVGNDPNSLQGFPDPVGIYNPKFGSNITMPNKIC